MNSDDLYSILGVLPEAEDVVIVAAYRALAQRYHPDRWKGDPSIAHDRMSAINAAYEVLGNSQRRFEYDKSRPKSAQAEFSTEEQTEQSEAFSSALTEIEVRWKVATSIYPDLEALRDSLGKISTSLAFSYATALLESKAYGRRKEIASSLEKSFLQRYFGNNEQIVEFARTLIFSGQRDAAKALNRLVDVMGSEIEPDLLFFRIQTDFGIQNDQEEIKKKHLEHLINSVRAGHFDEACQLGRMLDYKVEQVWRHWFSVDPEIHVTRPDKSQIEFKNTITFVDWAKKELWRNISHDG